MNAPFYALPDDGLTRVIDQIESAAPLFNASGTEFDAARPPLLTHLRQYQDASAALTMMFTSLPEQRQQLKIRETALLRAFEAARQQLLRLP